MPPTGRRDALKVLALVAGALAPPSARPVLSQPRPTLNSAPIVGHTTDTTAIVWVQVFNAKSITLRYRAADATADETVSVEIDPNHDGVALITLTKLTPSTRYQFDVLAGSVRLAPAQSFRTAHYAEHDFSFALGSCHFPERLHPTGDAYGDDFGIFDAMASALSREKQPHFMLWLGDNLYLRRAGRFTSADYASPEAMAMRYRNVRGMAHLQKLFAATQHYAIWDDHDYGPNNADRTFAHKDTSLELFARYWPNPPMGSSALPGTWFSFRQGDAECFCLDDRFYRDAEADAPSPTKQMFGKAQLDWLRAGLANSTARFKLVANGSQLLSELPNGNQSGWHSYKTERDGFLEWLTRTKIGGLILLSGDRHNTQVFKLDRDGQAPLFELSISPLTSRPSKLSKAEKANPRLVKSLVVEDRNYGTLSFVGNGKDRKAVARCFDSSGKQLWEQVVA